MRGGELRVTVSASRSGGEREAAGGGEPASVCSYIDTTAFGWLLPHAKTKRRGVIDAAWLREFSSDIDILRSEMRKQATFVCIDEKPNHEGNVQTECQSECSPAVMKQKHRVGDPWVTASSHGSFNSSVRPRSLNSKDVAYSEVASGEATSRKCYSDQAPSKVKTQELTQDVESLGSEKSYMLDSRFNLYTVGAKCDEYSSMQSDISRDSGVFSTDDTSLVSEAGVDKSLFQELKDVLGNSNESLAASIHCGSLPFEETMLSRKENCDRSVWLSRFSSSNDLSSEWGSQETCPFSCISPVTRMKSNSLEDSGSHHSMEESDCLVTPPPAMSHEEEMFKIKQYKQCGKKSLLGHPSLQHISELSELTQFFRSLTLRVGKLQSGIKCLAGEVKETKRDLMSLEERTTQLLASTVTSRHRMTKFRALQALEDRLQEEWWTAYDPNTASSHENYIV